MPYVFQIWSFSACEMCSSSLYDKLHHSHVPRTEWFQIENIEITLFLGDILIISLTCLLQNRVEMDVLLHIEHLLAWLSSPLSKVYPDIWNYCW
jgi:hypothetical protein